MSILGKLGKQLSGELPTLSDASASESVSAVERRRPDAGERESRVVSDLFEYATADDDCQLVFLRRQGPTKGENWPGNRFPAETRELWAGARVPSYVDFVDGLFLPVRGWRERFSFELIVPRAKPPWLFAETRLAGDPSESDDLEFCFWCGRRFFWRDGNGAESCALCRHPRPDDGARFFLKRGLDGNGAELA